MQKIEDIVFVPEGTKVFVQTMAYNQSKYIVENLNGVAMQQTDFPFIHMVMDDCSTDGEQEVIKQWLKDNCEMANATISEIEESHVIQAQHKSNQNCYYLVFLLKLNLRKSWQRKLELMKPWESQCPYEAMCEGDDYWIDPKKLQKQVDLMNENADISLCHTGFRILIDETRAFAEASSVISDNIKIHSLDVDVTEEIIKCHPYRIQTVTVLYKTSSLYKANDVLKPYNGMFLMGDTQLWAVLSKEGKVAFLPEITSIYCSNRGTSSRPSTVEKRIRFDLSCAEMRVEMGKLLNVREDIVSYFQYQYQKKLCLYYCYDNSYNPFVELKFKGLKQKLQFLILTSKLVQPLLRFYCNSHYKNK